MVPFSKEQNFDHKCAWM